MHHNTNFFELVNPLSQNSSIGECTLITNELVVTSCSKGCTRSLCLLVQLVVKALKQPWPKEMKENQIC